MSEDTYDSLAELHRNLIKVIKTMKKLKLQSTVLRGEFHTLTIEGLSIEQRKEKDAA